jgi:3D (Asp-Asp-Asp) domain-containing protein
LSFRFITALVAALAVASPALAATSGGGSTPGGKPPVKAKAKPKPKPKPKPSPKPKYPISTPTWLPGVYTTEYWPVPERWFNGAKIVAPGLAQAHRVDFLYSAKGVAMEGDGIGLDGKRVHWATGSGAGWVDRSGHSGGYYWLAEMFWRNAKGEVTYPLEAGGWSNGPCRQKKKPTCSKVGSKGTRFGTGPSTGSSGLALHPLRSIAVDPNVIRYRSAVYIPAYDTAHHDGWFCAADTGGAIVGRHLDVYRNAPSSPNGGSTHSGQRIRVLPPATARSVMPFLCR